MLGFNFSLGALFPPSSICCMGCFCIKRLTRAFHLRLFAKQVEKIYHKPNFCISLRQRKITDSMPQPPNISQTGTRPNFAPLQPTMPLHYTLFCQQGGNPELANTGPVSQNEFASKSENMLPQAYLDFHKNYLSKRIEESGSKWVSSNQLFEEIATNGYRGAFKTMQTFLTTIRRKKDMPPEASFKFHRDYLKKRLIEEAGPKKIETQKLLEEIIVRGYRGSVSTLRIFLSDCRQKADPQASLGFHKGYIKNRLEESMPDYVPSKQLFTEITAKGYRGSLRTLQKFLSTIREKKKENPEASIGFHKGYIKDRLEKSMPDYVPPKQLLKEIKAKGYRGSVSTLQRFLSAVRGKKKPEALLGFYTGYIKYRLQESAPAYLSSYRLFKEIKAKGYRGSVSTLQRFLSTIREKGKFIGTSS